MNKSELNVVDRRKNTHICLACGTPEFDLCLMQGQAQVNLDLIPGIQNGAP